MTEGQRTAYDQHWQAYGLELETGVLDLSETFGRKAPTILEIGFGMGDSLIEMCVGDPASNFIGVEVHPPGVGRTINSAALENLQNFRVFLADAKDVLAECIPDQSLSRVQVYFPDPWHKRKHNKRRLLQAEFVRLISEKLEPEGVLHMATDWQEYAAQMLEVASEEPLLKNESVDGAYVPKPPWRPETKFERRGERLGHGVWDLLFKKAV
ncbi:UNVERIFIED_CONTAM: hypothetical protein GTU68_031115 [Idotea baltica]|nr:hypothetical protein [Idotea baltica]